MEKVRYGKNISYFAIETNDESKIQLLFDFEGPRKPKWGCSSAGRAPALQAGGQGFDSLHLHHGEDKRSDTDGDRLREVHMGS